MKMNVKSGLMMSNRGHHFNILAAMLGLALTAIFGGMVHAEISEECRAETELLLADKSLAISQQVIFEDYSASFNDKCEFALTNIGCSISFEGDERTYEALCDGSGGHVYKRPVTLTCLRGTVEHDLGYVPTCVGGSCNISLVEPRDIETEQVSAFLGNLTLTGCKADGSAAPDSYLSWGGSVTIVVLGVWTVSTMLAL